MRAVVEMPKGTKYKYEMKEIFGVKKLILDRVLNQAVPANYGYIPNTTAPDGDAEDIFIISDEPLVAGCEVEVEILGKFICIDNGVQDDKLVGYIFGEEEPRDLSKIRHYLSTYKSGFLVGNWEEV